MTWLAWFLPPLTLLAGWLFWTRLPSAPDEKHDRAESWFAAATSGVLLTGCVALLLAEAGFLRPWLLIALLLLLCAGLWRLPRRSPSPAPSSPGNLLAVACVTLGSAVLLAPASEDFIGWRDQGVYVNTGAWLAGHGTLRIHNGALASLTDESRDVFRWRRLLPGFFAQDEEPGLVVPEFLHLHPVYLALGYWLGGMRGAFLVPPLYGVLAHLALFFFVRRMLGTGPALVSVAVIGVNLLQIWLNRMPLSEGVTQFAWLTALWAVAGAAQTGSIRWGVVGGMALGAGFLLRIDGALLLAALLPAFAVLHASTARRERWVAALLPITLAMAVWGVWHVYVFSPPYANRLSRWSLPLWTGTAALLLVYAAFWPFRRRARVIADWVYRHGHAWWTAAALVVGLTFVYGLWIRPIRASSPYGLLVAEGMLRVALYVTVPGMVAACVGTIVILRRWLVERRVDWVPFLAAFLGLALAYFWNPRSDFDHPWGMRRVVPMILPGLAIAISAAIAWLWQVRFRWRLATRVAAVALLAVILIGELRASWPFRGFREKEGSIEQVAAIARHIPPDALLLYTEGSEVWVTMPLAFFWQREALPVRARRRHWSDEEGRRRFENQVVRWLREGREIRYFTKDESSWEYLTHGLRWEPLASFDVRYRTAGVSRTELPREPVTLGRRYHLLRVTLAPEPPPPCAGLRLDAAEPVSGMTQGFYQVEGSPLGNFRWTLPRSRVMLPRCDRTGQGALRLRVRAACTRSDVPDACRVRVTVNNWDAGTLELSPRWDDHELPIPAEAVAQPLGAIDVRFFGPMRTSSSSAGRRPDARVLSFRVQTIAIER